MSKNSKNAKLNLTLDLEFYEDLKVRANEEHLPTATFVKKYLMDNLPKNNIEDIENAG
jgi:hypothetical protein